MLKSTFTVAKMDCPAEENLVRMKLSEIPTIHHLEFDLIKRTLVVFHTEHIEKILSSLHQLQLDTTFVRSENVEEQIFNSEENTQRKILWLVLSINFGFFLLEILFGFFSHSMGLVADSLDMLADTIVYGLSLFAIGGTIVRKKKVATLSGYFQILLAVMGFIEVLRRFFGADTPPEFLTMIIVSLFALIGNAVCLYLLQKSQSKEAHIQASMIFTSNDVVINVGVIAAGVLVNMFHSNKPDLIIGMIVFMIVIRGAVRILRLGK